MNGASAFMAVGRVREFLADGMPFDTAVESVAANTIFTTHTPVSAGNEAFMLPLFHSYFQPWCERHGMDFHRLLELGTLTEKERLQVLLPHGADHPPEPLRQRRVTAARRGQPHHVAPPLAPGAHRRDPIGHVTNGIHTGTWISDGFRELYEQHVGQDWERKLGRRKPGTPCTTYRMWKSGTATSC